MDTGILGSFQLSFLALRNPLFGKAFITKAYSSNRSGRVTVLTNAAARRIGT